jgi:DNA-binding HxlR family transcriptional regulator
LKREVGDVTQKSLTAVLTDLEKDGLVERRVCPNIPPRVEYAITPLGQSLWGALGVLSNWAIDNRAAVVEARNRFANVAGVRS